MEYDSDNTEVIVRRTVKKVRRRTEAAILGLPTLPTPPEADANVQSQIIPEAVVAPPVQQSEAPEAKKKVRKIVKRTMRKIMYHDAETGREITAYNGSAEAFSSSKKAPADPEPGKSGAFPKIKITARRSVTKISSTGEQISYSEEECSTDENPGQTKIAQEDGTTLIVKIFICKAETIESSGLFITTEHVDDGEKSTLCCETIKMTNGETLIIRRHVSRHVKKCILDSDNTVKIVEFNEPCDPTESEGVKVAVDAQGYLQIIRTIVNKKIRRSIMLDSGQEKTVSEYSERGDLVPKQAQVRETIEDGWTATEKSFCRCITRRFHFGSNDFQEIIEEVIDSTESPGYYESFEGDGTRVIRLILKHIFKRQIFKHADGEEIHDVEVVSDGLSSFMCHERRQYRNKEVALKTRVTENKIAKVSKDGDKMFEVVSECAEYGSLGKTMLIDKEGGYLSISPIAKYKIIKAVMSESGEEKILSETNKDDVAVPKEVSVEEKVDEQGNKIVEKRIVQRIVKRIRKLPNGCQEISERTENCVEDAKVRVSETMESDGTRIITRTIIRRIIRKKVKNEQGEEEIHEYEEVNDGDKVVVDREVIETPNGETIISKRTVKRFIKKYIRKPDGTEDIVEREVECDEDTPEGKIETVDEEGNRIVITTVVRKIVRRVKRTKTGEEQVLSEAVEDEDLTPRKFSIEEKVDEQGNQVVEKRIVRRIIKLIRKLSSGHEEVVEREEDCDANEEAGVSESVESDGTRTITRIIVRRIIRKTIKNEQGEEEIHECEEVNDGEKIVVDREVIETPSGETIVSKRTVKRFIKKYIRKLDGTEDIVEREVECDENAPEGKIETVDEEGNRIVITTVVRKVIRRVKRTKTGEEQILFEMIEDENTTKAHDEHQELHTSIKGKDNAEQSEVEISKEVKLVAKDDTVMAAKHKVIRKTVRTTIRTTIIDDVEFRLVMSKFSKEEEEKKSAIKEPKLISQRGNKSSNEYDAKSEKSSATKLDSDKTLVEDIGSSEKHITEKTDYDEARIILQGKLLDSAISEEIKTSMHSNLLAEVENTGKSNSLDNIDSELTQESISEKNSYFTNGESAESESTNGILSKIIQDDSGYIEAAEIKISETEHPLDKEHSSFIHNIGERRIVKRITKRIRKLSDGQEEVVEREEDCDADEEAGVSETVEFDGTRTIIRTIVRRIIRKTIKNEQGEEETHECEEVNDGDKVIVSREVVETPSGETIISKRIVKRFIKKYIRKPDGTEDIVEREVECDENAPEGKIETVDEEGNRIVITTVVRKVIRRVKRTKTGEEQVISEAVEEGEIALREVQKLESVDEKLTEKAHIDVIEDFIVPREENVDTRCEGNVAVFKGVTIEETIVEETVDKVTVDKVTVIKETAIDEAAVEGKVVEETAAENAITKETVVEETVVKKMVVEEVTVEKAAAEKGIAEEGAVEGAVVRETAVEEAITKDTVVEKTVVEQITVEETVTEGIITRETVIEEVIAEKAVVEETVTEICEDTKESALMPRSEKTETPCDKSSAAVEETVIKRKVTGEVHQSVAKDSSSEYFSAEKKNIQHVQVNTKEEETPAFDLLEKRIVRRIVKRIRKLSSGQEEVVEREEDCDANEEAGVSETVESDGTRTITRIIVRRIIRKTVRNAQGEEEIHECEEVNDGDNVVISREVIETPSGETIISKRTVKRFVKKYIRKLDGTEDVVEREVECDENAPEDKIEIMDEEGNRIVITTVVRKAIRRVKRTKTGEEQVISEAVEEGEIIPKEFQTSENIDEHLTEKVHIDIIEDSIVPREEKVDTPCKEDIVVTQKIATMMMNNDISEEAVVPKNAEKTASHNKTKEFEALKSNKTIVEETVIVREDHIPQKDLENNVTEVTDTAEDIYYNKHSRKDDLLDKGRPSEEVEFLNGENISYLKKDKDLEASEESLIKDKSTSEGKKKKRITKVIRQRLIDDDASLDAEKRNIQERKGESSSSDIETTELVTTKRKLKRIIRRTIFNEDGTMEVIETAEDQPLEEKSVKKVLVEDRRRKSVIQKNTLRRIVHNEDGTECIEEEEQEGEKALDGKEKIEKLLENPPEMRTRRRSVTTTKGPGLSADITELLSKSNEAQSSVSKEEASREMHQSVSRKKMTRHLISADGCEKIIQEEGDDALNAAAMQQKNLSSSREKKKVTKRVVRRMLTHEDGSQEVIETKETVDDNSPIEGSSRDASFASLNGTQGRQSLGAKTKEKGKRPESDYFPYSSGSLISDQQRTSHSNSVSRGLDEGNTMATSRRTEDSGIAYPRDFDQEWKDHGEVRRRSLALSANLIKTATMSYGSRSERPFQPYGESSSRRSVTNILSDMHGLKVNGTKLCKVTKVTTVFRNEVEVESNTESFQETPDVDERIGESENVRESLETDINGVETRTIVTTKRKVYFANDAGRSVNIAKVIIKTTRFEEGLDPQVEETVFEEEVAEEVPEGETRLDEYETALNEKGFPIKIHKETRRIVRRISQNEKRKIMQIWIRIIKTVPGKEPVETCEYAEKEASPDAPENETQESQESSYLDESQNGVRIQRQITKKIILAGEMSKPPPKRVIKRTTTIVTTQTPNQPSEVEECITEEVLFGVEPGESESQTSSSHVDASGRKITEQIVFKESTFYSDDNPADTKMRKYKPSDQSLEDEKVKNKSRRASKFAIFGRLKDKLNNPEKK